MPFLRPLLLVFVGAAFLSLTAADALAEPFITPQPAYRPWVWAHWLHGNVDRASITRELEAMQRVGLGGLTMFDVAQPGIPAGPHAYMGDSWQEMFAFEISEAKRLGLQVMSHNGPGYSGNGGPWIPLERASQMVVTSSLRIPGGQRFAGVLPKPTTKGDWYRDVAVLAIDETEAQVAPVLPKEAGDAKRKRLTWLNYIGWAGAASAPLNLTLPPEVCIPRQRVVNVTAHLAADGTLTWDAPAGTWTILRCGHAWTGQKTLPATRAGDGPECDKLDPRGIQLHFAKVMERMVALGGTASGTTFPAFFADSWEAGGQNWTERMPEEFRQRRGYDPIPFLPILAGRVLDDLQTSERFLYDLRQTVSELATENFWAEMQRLCHAHGMRLAAEAYITTGNDLDATEYLDEPMGEFWTVGSQGLDYRRSVKMAASVGNFTGRLRIGVEAFTANQHERWRSHPALLKPLGDQILCLGANRFQIHRFAMQRFADLKPGMMMGPWGLQYDRTQTWWEWTKPWHDYLARCQYLLSQGPIVTDVLLVAPEEPLWRFAPITIPGHDYDVCGPDRFRTIAVQADGRPGVAGGPTYGLISVSHDGRMTLDRLRRIRDLLQAGATILCDPPTAIPGLDPTGRAEADFKTLVAELWGSAKAKDQRLGKGRLLCGVPVTKAIDLIGLAPDTDVPKDVSWIHRRNAEADWWFVAHAGNEARTVTCSLRLNAPQAERWDPESCTITALPTTVREGRTLIDLPLGPTGSAFIVVRRTPATTPPPAPAPTACAAPVSVPGPWTLHFPADSGVAQDVTLAHLGSWSEHPDPAVQAFSGTATYRTTFTVPPGTTPVRLDLGQVAVMARVRVNGVDQGILWKAPYAVTLTAPLKDGANDLEVEVVNLWINRLIRDAALPDETTRTKDGVLTAWPAWVLSGGTTATGRQSFVTIPQWKATEALVPAGLLGPVTVGRVEGGVPQRP